MDYLGPCSKPVEAVIDFISKLGVRHVTYIIRYKQNVLELNDSVKDLGFEKERINHQCDEIEKNLNNIEGKVTEWIRKVNEIETIVKVFENDDGHKRAKSLSCYVFPYLLNRHRLGRQAKKMEVDVKKLIDESPNFDEVSYRENVTSNDTTLFNSGFVEFGSTKSTMEKVMTQLEHSTVRMIGLYGPAGVGKSTLVKEIARKAKEKKVFDVVVKVEITANPNLQNVQEEIAYVLGLRLEGEGENVRADCLRRRLKKEKGNTLLILDDLWDKLDLNKLGIPLDDDEEDYEDVSISDSKDHNHQKFKDYNHQKLEDHNQQKLDKKNDNNDHSDQKLEKNNDNKDHTYKVLNKEKILSSHKGCKILLTSRDKKILCDKMDIKSTFCIKELDDKDALMLFQKLAGIRNEMSDSKQEIVKKYCGGLPMAIVTVARALRSKSEPVWEATLEKLKKQELVEVQTSMDISVKMSYDHLENEEIKSIFLLCAQMGHHPLIMDLVKNCFGLGILEGVSSIWEARDRIKTSIQKLKDSGLLLDGSSNNHFNMHDLVRDAALSIANNDRNVFTLRNGKLDDWPELESCTSISICSCDIVDGLPKEINCSRLKFFQIDTNDPSLIIPENIFEGMKNLKVLILIGFRLSRLPSSIKFLIKLRMLCLERCTIDENLSIGKLEKLRILSFSGSQLKNLPIELGCLDKLQLLDISDCSIMDTNIPPHLLSSLTHLEELYIRKSLIKTLVEGETNQGQNSFLSELKNLSLLKVVDLSIPCVSVFPHHLFFDRLKDYKIVVGDLEMFSVGDFRMPDKYETFRVLALQLNDAIDIHSYEGIKMLFKTVQCLLLGNVDGVQNVVNELNVDGFPYLKYLYIVNNNNIKSLNSTKLSNCVDIFPNLESLCLYNLVNLEMICYGLLTAGSFAKLKAIKVDMCNRLKNLHSFYAVKFHTSSKTCEISECNSFMDKFPTSVEIIEVYECGSLKEILQIPVDYGQFEFHKLQSLTLQSLPSFTSFYTKVDGSYRSHVIEIQTINGVSREIVGEEDEQNDKTPPLFGELVAIPNLESLNISSLNIHKIWSDKHSSCFWGQNLIKIVVKRCDKLTYLCSLSMANGLKKLKSLVISECLIMEKIFETEENSADKVCVFPKLEEIHLSKMNRLTSIWETKVSVDSFSNLVSLEIEECNKLNKIFPSHMKGWVECLDNLTVCSCPSVEVIFEINDYEEIDEFGGIDTNLQVILLENLPKLKQLWSTDPNGILNFKKLRTIDVYNCNELRNLFPASVAKDVPKLERISTLHCEKMVEIVASQVASDANDDSLVFSELTCVRLQWLPNMKHFYKGKHLIKCPKLKELSIGTRVKLKTFLKETSEITKKEEKCVFSAEEVLPNLEYMEIDFNEAQELLPKYQMQCLKELNLMSVESVDLLWQLPYCMSNLEKLKMVYTSFREELEPRANFARQERFGIALQLKELVLVHSKIRDLGLGRVPILQRLELLSLKNCEILNSLAPPSISLTYLTYLELKSCRGLRNLMAFSTAQSMVQLKTMKVINCHGVVQIVSNEGSGKGKVMKIVFSKLISIELVGLNYMRSFCSSKECEFEFPSLEILIVRECPVMEKFSERRPITPKLKNVFGVEGDEKARWQWEDNLNATIQKVFNNKVTFRYTEDLLHNYGTDFIIQQLWRGIHSVHQSSFRYLKRLKALECNALECVIPSHLLFCFENLEELDIQKCRAARVIFNIGEKSRTMASGIFRLKSLSLSKLEQLEHVWDKDPEGIIGLKVLQEVHVEECGRLESLFPASVAKDLTRLQVLQVKECLELSEIFRKDGKGGEEEGTTQHSLFPRLTTLTLDQLPHLKYSIHSKEEVRLTNFSLRYSPLQEQLCLGSWTIPNTSFSLLDSLTLDGCHFSSDVLLPFNLLPFLNNLEKLELRNCSSIKTIFDVKCTTQDTMTFPLKELILSYLPDLENVWNEDPNGILSMHHLKEVNVEYCNGLANVFPASIAQDLVKLENLVVQNCNGLMTIVAEDASGTNQELPCPCVRSLELKHLPMFKYFYYCSQQCNNFAHLKSHTEDEVYFEKGLSLGENGVEMILRGKFQRKLLRNIKVLTLFRCESKVFPYKILKEVPNIEKLVLIDGTFMEIFKSQSPNNLDYSELVLQLKVLHLEFLRGSVSIGLENSWIEPFVRDLETLKVICCGSLENLVACKVSFSNMTYLKVQSCNSLSYLFTSSTAKSLSQLKKMKVKLCESIKEIVSKEEGEESDENRIIFPKLSRLSLDCLGNLRNFYRGNLNFPSLEELSITNCHHMITFCTGTLKTDMLSEVILDDSGVLPLETNLNSTMQKEFLKEISELYIAFVYDGSGLQEIWNDSLQIPPDFCFSKLAKLTVGHCRFLSDAVLPFHLLPLLPNLETLEVRNCDSVKTIFDVSLDISDFYFSKLATLIVEACPFLSDAVLPFYLLPLLPNLETLEVRNCDSVKTIFDVKCTTKHTLIIFPMKKLVLCKLPNLETVWNEDPRGILCMQLLQKVHVKNCNSLPSVFPASIANDLVKLESLVVEECERLMVIVAEDNITDPRGTNVEITFPCPCVRSLELRDLPKFKYFYYCPLKSDIYKNMESHPEDHLDAEKCLSLGENGVEMILRGEFPRNLLDNLKVLALCFHLDAFRYEILEQVPNVEKLMVCDGFFKEIFCYESPNNVDYYSRFLLHLKVLHLESLQDFISIGLNLVASRLPLSNLTCLKVQGCRRLLYLLTSSTVKSLGQLKRMEIKDCTSIKEIVSNEKDESDEDEIIFPQLSCLNLNSLWDLQKFYGGSLSFPSLKEFSVTNSDKMITLCSGTLKTAKLSHVKFEEFREAIPPEFDLNYNMRKRFLIKRASSDCSWDRSLEFRDRVDLQEIWRLSLHIPRFCFRYLEILIVNGCQFLSYVLPFTLLPLLPQLETLEVRNCDSVKAIFDVKCTVQDTLITFPLKTLVLSKLPNLETVWNEDPHGILSMQRLKEVNVDNCKRLTSVFPASLVKDLEKLENLVVKDCEGLITIVAEESDDQDKKIIFERLQILDLKRLEKLRCFYPGNFALCFPYLKEVHVIKCSSMKTFSTFNKIDHSIKLYYAEHASDLRWFYAEYASHRVETDLNSAVRRTFEQEAPDASSAIISVLQ